ncbi:hypothetical protein GCM10017556_52930 [Micromonospora sagamiensis]|nr:hypothetical protein GCM10017556_52930 [Micromonospora sagamiensis]
MATLARRARGLAATGDLPDVLTDLRAGPGHHRFLALTAAKVVGRPGDGTGDDHRSAADDARGRGEGSRRSGGPGTRIRRPTGIRSGRRPGTWPGIRRTWPGRPGY